MYRNVLVVSSTFLLPITLHGTFDKRSSYYETFLLPQSIICGQRLIVSDPIDFKALVKGCHILNLQSPNKCLNVLNGSMNDLRSKGFCPWLCPPRRQVEEFLLGDGNFHRLAISGCAHRPTGRPFPPTNEIDLEMSSVSNQLSLRGSPSDYF